MNTCSRWWILALILPAFVACTDEPAREPLDGLVNDGELEDAKEDKNEYIAIGLCASDTGESPNDCPEECFEVRGVRVDSPKCTAEAPLLGCADRAWSPYPEGYDTTADMPPYIWSKNDGFGYALREEYKDWTRELRAEERLTRGCWDPEHPDCISVNAEGHDPCALD